MSSDLERALSKLRFDDQVLGYSLMTKAGRPFVSFSFPDELFPRVRDSIGLYKSDLRLMTIDTEKGLVVLSPVDDNWILTVLYVPELQLGLAIAKTKNVLRLLEGIELPPPPDEFEESAESNLQVLESIALKAASTTPEPSPEPAKAPAETPPEPAPEPVIEIPPVEEPSPPQETIPSEQEISPDAFDVVPTTIPKRGGMYSNALSLESELHAEMKETYRNFGYDVLMLVDGTIDVEKIADSMFQSVERVTELLKWAAAKRIIEVPQIEIASTATGGAVKGRFVKVPKFEGDLSKIKEPDLSIIKLCDGRKTTEQIAEVAGIAHPKVIQLIAKYRKTGMKMIGKTL